MAAAPQHRAEVGERSDENLREAADHERLQHSSIIRLAVARDSEGAGHGHPPGDSGHQLHDSGSGPRHALAGVDRQHRTDRDQPERIHDESAGDDDRFVR